MGGRRTVVITGAGHGLGLEWASQDLAEGATVVATARDPAASPGLDALREARRHGSTQAGGELVVLGMDVTGDASVEGASREIERRFGSIDDLINNAGTFGPRDDAALGVPPDEARRVIEVNSVGPLRVTRAFLPLLRRARRPRIVFITSRMGSIGDGPSGGAYAYRMSKSALNMLAANLAADLRGDGVLCLVLHPGWVRTRMGGPGGRVDAATSVAGMRRVLGGATLKQSGAFFDYQGQIVPW